MDQTQFSLDCTSELAAKRLESTRFGRSTKHRGLITNKKQEAKSEFPIRIVNIMALVDTSVFRYEQFDLETNHFFSVGWFGSRSSSCCLFEVFISIALESRRCGPK
jgi:hypothetical protein